MKIEFDKNKLCKAYKELVENPENRSSHKAFARAFNNSLAKAAIKLHKKLTNAQNAYVYNLITSSDNRIGLKEGVKHHEPLVLKVRIQDSYRKFFYFCENNSQGKEEFGLKKNWGGQFENILKIYVYEVNKHDYSKA